MDGLPALAASCLILVGKREDLGGQQVRDWGRTLIRSFGIANWFYGLTGAYFLVDGFRRADRFGPHPYESKAYYFLVTINALFLVAIFLTGYWLILIRRRGVVFSNYFFPLKKLSEKTGAPVAELVRRAIDRYLRD